MLKHCSLCHANYRRIEFHLVSVRHTRNLYPVRRDKRIRIRHVSTYADYESRMWAEEEARAIEDGTYTPEGNE